MKFTDEEKKLMIEGLQMKICMIETGTAHLRAGDIAATSSVKDRFGRSEIKGEIRALSIEQMKTIIKLDELIKKVESL